MYIHKYIIFLVIVFIFVFQFILFGIISILSEKYPSPCLVSGSDVLICLFIQTKTMHIISYYLSVQHDLSLHNIQTCISTHVRSFYFH